MLAKKTDIGALRERIEIQEETATRGAAGQEVLTWGTFARCWAAVKNAATGNFEEIKMDQITVGRRIDFEIRTRPDVTEKNRVVYLGDSFGIIGIEKTGRSRTMVLRCILVE